MATNQQGLNNLATILKRLEAATARLEDVAHHNNPTTSSAHSSSPAPTSGALFAGAAQGNNSAPAAKAETAKSPAVKAYQDDIIDGVLKEYAAKSQEIGGPVAEHANLISNLTNTQFAHLTLASSCTKPTSQDLLIKLLTPTQEALKAVADHKDKASRGKEGRQWGNHLSTVGEGAGAWGWVAVEPTPAPFVGEMKDSAQFWANRVIKEFKETDKKHIAWVNSFIALIDRLQKYVKQYHTTGLVWNPKGQDPSSYQASGESDASAPPPPPPGPAPPAHDFNESSTSSPAPAQAAGGPSAFLSQINQGEGLTSKLKKVDASQQTHKNPELRAGSVVAATDKATPAPPTKPKPTTLTQKRPAETRLDGTKWIVEYHENAKHVVIEDTEINHTVHLFGCKNSVIEIKGKVNAISAVNCSKTSILLGSVVSGLSITSSPSFTVQILGQVPTIQIDNTDSGQVYLSKECVDTVEIITSKTSAINISLPGTEEGDYEEKPIPEQMKSIIKGGKVITTIVEHSG